MTPPPLHQGGDLARATPPDFGFALPLAGLGQTSLEALPVSGDRLWSTEVVERYGFDATGITVTITSDYRGGAADAMRARWATTARNRITEEFFTYYATRYPGLDLARPVEMQHDRTANHLRMVEHYRLPLAALTDYGLAEDFPFAAEDFASNLPERLTAPRALPMDTGRPARFHHRIEVTGAPVDFTPPGPLHTGFEYGSEFFLVYLLCGIGAEPDPLNGIEAEAAQFIPEMAPGIEIPVLPVVVEALRRHFTANGLVTVPVQVVNDNPAPL